MSNPFIVTKPYGYGDRTETVLDIQAFTDELAAALGGKVERPQEKMDYQYWGKIILPCKLMLILSRLNGKNDLEKVTINVRQSDVTLSHGDTPRDVKFPEIKLPTGKDMTSICRDIRRRIIEPALPMAELVRARFAEIEAHKAQAAKAVELFTTEWPGMRVTIDQDGRSAALSYFPGEGKPGVWFGGRLNSDGSVSFDRIGGMTSERAKLVLHALTCEV